MTRVSAIVGPLLALVASLCLFTMPSAAQRPGANTEAVKAAIAVHVLNEAGKPAHFADVALMNADGKKVAMRHADFLGRAFFAPVPPGDYVVRAARLGQGKGEESVTAEDGKLAKVVVHLKKQ